MSRRKVFVVGVGMTKFEKPQTKKWDYPDMGREAGLKALQDANVPYSSIQGAVASYCYGEPTSGHKAVYELGLTGIPIFNVNSNCSSASSAIMLCRSLVQSGMDCVMAMGFEKMERGLSQHFLDRVSPIARHTDQMKTLGVKPGPLAPGMNEFTSDVIKLYAYAAREYVKKYPNVSFEDFGRIALKNRNHGTNNQYACFQTPTTLEKVCDKNKILSYPITQAMSSMTADGGAAAVLCSEDFVKRHGLQNKAVEILAQHMLTDLPSSFQDNLRDLSGYHMAETAAQKCYADTGLGPKDIDVVELHDCFSCNELFMYEALHLANEGKGMDLFNSGKWEMNSNGGKVYRMADKWVVNPSGGLESKGHPIGATGLGQCAELVWQLRGEAGKRQVEDAKVGLQHNYGIGGAAVVTMYKKYQGQNQIASKL